MKTKIKKPSPVESATPFPIGFKKLGQDNQFWEVSQTASGKRWKKCRSPEGDLVIISAEKGINAYISGNKVEVWSADQSCDASSCVCTFDNIKSYSSTKGTIVLVHKHMALTIIHGSMIHHIPLQDSEEYVKCEGDNFVSVYTNQRIHLPSVLSFSRSCTDVPSISLSELEGFSSDVDPYSFWFSKPWICNVSK